MSNSEPSAIVLQGIPCMCGLYKVSIRMEKTVRSRFAAIHTKPAQIGTATGTQSSVRSCRTCVVRRQACVAPGAPPKAAGLSPHAL